MIRFVNELTVLHINKRIHLYISIYRYVDIYSTILTTLAYCSIFQDKSQTLKVCSVSQWLLEVI